MQKILVDKARAIAEPCYFISKFTLLKLSDGQEVCINALAKDHRVIIKAGRRWGKTKVAAAAAIWFAWTRPNVKIGYFAPSWDQCKIFMDEIYKEVSGTLLESSFQGEPRKFGFELTNGSQVIAKTANISSQSGRGHGFDLSLLDESAFIPDEVMAAIRPTRLVGSGWEMQMSNPCGHNHFYKDFSSKIFTRFSFRSEDNPLVNKAELLKEKDLMTEFEYKQEYEAEFIDDEFSAFPSKLIDRSRTLGMERNLNFLREGLPDHDYFMGVDLGRKHDKSVIVIVDNMNPILDVVFKLEIKNDFSDRYWTKVLDEVEFWAKAFRVKKIKIDQTAIGDKPTLDLKQSFAEKSIPCIIDGVMFSNSTLNSRGGLVSSLIMRFERYQIAIPHYPELVKQLKNVRRKIIIQPLKEATSKFNLSGLDHVTALALAVEATPYHSQSLFYARTNKRLPSLNHSSRGGLMRVY